MQPCQKKASQAGMSLQCLSLMLLCLSSCHFAQALPLGLWPRKQLAFYSNAERLATACLLLLLLLLLDKFG